jgi:hypothetical protein
MVEVSVVIIILALHLLGDFFLQSDWMAVNKSKSYKALAVHCFVYASCFALFGLSFFIVTYFTHLVTDGITSRITSRLYTAGKRHWFFVVIGVDQFIHYVTLLLSYVFLRQV